MLKYLIATICILQINILLTEACPIYLTIALNGKNYYDSNLEINWGPNCYQKPGWIGIFTEDPSVSNIHPEFRFDEVANNSGTIMSNVKVGKLRFPKGWNRYDVGNVTEILPRIPAFGKGKCLKYYVASFNENELLNVECLKIQPNWMYNIDSISDLPLKELFIPGTHASGAYVSDYGKVISHWLRDYLITQPFSVWNQLIFGIRYLDFSIGFTMANEKYDKSTVDNFYVVNENMILNPLRKILKDIKHFVQLSHELVILDFSSFPIGFYQHPERHGDLVHLIFDELNDLMFERESDITKRKNCYDLTLDEIRKSEKYILVLYPLEELPFPEKESPILCPSWKRFTTSFMNMSDALDLMRALYSKKNISLVQDEGWVFHAITSLEHSLNTNNMKTAKERAQGINQKVNGWLKGPWGLNANVVTLDYFCSTNLIDVAIYANKQKAFRAKNKNFLNFELAT